MDRLGERTGRQYRLVDYTGHPEAERVLVLMGSGGETAAETVAYLSRRASGSACCRCGCTGRSRPGRCSTRCPRACAAVAVLDRTKEPGSIGEPLFLDVVAALTEAHADGERAVLPRVTGGRYGLSSKEFTPGMVAGVFAELAREQPRRRFTIGINDDVVRHQPAVRPVARHRAPRHGPRGLLRPRLGRHGRREQEHHQDPRLRGAAARPGLLRLRLEEVGLADRVAPALRAASDPRAVPGAAGQLRRLPSVRAARPGRRARPGRPGSDAAAQLLARRRTRCGTRCPGRSRSRSSTSGIDVYAIDADRIAREAGLAGRTNTVLQTCFFAISGVLPRDEAIARIKAAIAKTYGRRGAEVVARNDAAVDRALAGLHQIEVPEPGHLRPGTAGRSCRPARRSSSAR